MNVAREEAIRSMDEAWKNASATNGTDVAIPIQLALAQVSATLYVGDQIGRLIDALSDQGRGS